MYYKTAHINAFKKKKKSLVDTYYVSVYCVFPQWTQCSQWKWGGMRLSSL